MPSSNCNMAVTIIKTKAAVPANPPNSQLWKREGPIESYHLLLICLQLADSGRWGGIGSIQLYMTLNRTKTSKHGKEIFKEEGGLARVGGE